MTRTQIQLPEPLYGRLRQIAHVRDISLAEVIRRGMEIYAMSCPEVEPATKPWTMPLLRGSGGHRVDPASIKGEALAIESRSTRHKS